MMMSQHDWEKMCEKVSKKEGINMDNIITIKNPNWENIATTPEVRMPLDVYEKLKQDSETLARIKEYVNNLGKQ